MIWEVEFIPRVKWLWYICEGWTVEPMQGRHGRFSYYASRRVA